MGYLDDQPWKHYVYKTEQRPCKEEAWKSVSIHEYLEKCGIGVANLGGLSVKER